VNRGLAVGRSVTSMFGLVRGGILFRNAKHRKYTYTLGAKYRSNGPDRFVSERHRRFELLSSSTTSCSFTAGVSILPVPV
jgi:hypothetical protein